MNRRIQELAEQARQYANSMYPSGLDIPKWGPAYHEKFAELIVQECADLCDRFQARDVGMQPAECAGAIRKMFGVE